MVKAVLFFDDVLYPFYEKIGQQAQKSPEQVMSDVLFRFAGEASIEAIHKTRRGK